MIEVTETREPPIAAATLPHTSVDATTSSVPGTSPRAPPAQPESAPVASRAPMTHSVSPARRLRYGGMLDSWTVMITSITILRAEPPHQPNPRARLGPAGG